MMEKEILIKRFYWIDFLRGLAAVSVLLWHYQHFFYVEAGKSTLTDRTAQPFYDQLSFFYQQGGHAVQLFWVISGFVFTKVYLSESDNISARKFVVHRISRLYPLHIITLCVVAFLQFVSFKLFSHYQIYPFNDAYHFLLNILLASDWGLQKGFSFNAPIWSVSVEVIIYFIFFLFLKFKQADIRYSIILCLLFFITSRSAGHAFSQCGMFFFGGGIVFQIWKGFGIINKYSTLIIGLICFSLSYLFLNLLTRFGNISSGDVDLLLKCTFLVFVFAGFDFLDEKSGIGRRIGLFGDLTYGSYLWHVPIQITALILIEYVGIDREILSYNACLIIFVVGVFFSAYLSLVLIEQPSQIAINRAADKRLGL